MADSTPINAPESCPGVTPIRMLLPNSKFCLDAMKHRV